MNSNKKLIISKYVLILSLLLLNIWCGFFNNLLLSVAGGVLVTLINFVICAYLMIKSKRLNNPRVLNKQTSNFLALWIGFGLIYILIFSLAWDYLPQSSFAGFFVLPKQVYNMLFGIVYLSALLVVPKNLKPSERKQVSSFLLFIFFTVALVNLVVVLLNPDLSKTESYTETSSIFTLGYTLSYCIALIPPIILYKINTTHKKKWFFIAILIISLLSIYFAAYFIAITAALLSIALYFIFNSRGNIISRIIILSLIIAFIIFINTEYFVELLVYLSKTIQIEFISDRCREIAEFMQVGMSAAEEGETTYRFFIYQDTLSNFFKSPIFGNFVFGNYDCQYDHATILDMLASGGLLLTLPFFFLLSKGYKHTCSYLSNNRAKKALLAILVTYIYLACFNPVLSYMYFGVIFMVAPIVMGDDRNNEDIISSSL